ncbi:hypothetical protein IGI04_036126 [Brassica rapa subsp. trilocularis]|uniref:Uncharacterized protein n=1 Tax=Brassica rapa subsp. trilocularis TaxID=1813537 RepID=A0ABQ7LFY6_BRACM|nr:hypothetical protein IGI04_036126 [Brassica rapa subsp. trilocularis]
MDSCGVDQDPLSKVLFSSVLVDGQGEYSDQPDPSDGSEPRVTSRWETFTLGREGTALASDLFRELRVSRLCTHCGFSVWFQLRVIGCACSCLIVARLVESTYTKTRSGVSHMHTNRSLRSDRARAKLGCYVATELFRNVDLTPVHAFSSIFRCYLPKTVANSVHVFRHSKSSIKLYSKNYGKFVLYRKEIVINILSRKRAQRDLRHDSRPNLRFFNQKPVNRRTVYAWCARKDKCQNISILCYDGIRAEEQLSIFDIRAATQLGFCSIKVLELGISPIALESQALTLLSPPLTYTRGRQNHTTLFYSKPHLKSNLFHFQIAIKYKQSNSGPCQIWKNSFDQIAIQIKKTLDSLKKPAMATVLLGLLLFYDPNSAFAASGGKIGGNSFPSTSDPSARYSAPYYRPSPFSGGLYVGFGFGGFSSFSLILVGFAAFIVVFGFLSDHSQGSTLTDTQKTSVLKLHVGLLGLGRTFNRLAENDDTSTSEGLSYVLTEATLALLRYPDYCISCNSSGKFDEETLVNVNSVKRQSSKNWTASCFSNEYIAVEVLWTPQNEKETLSENELLEDYPLLRLLPDRWAKRLLLHQKQTS